MSSSSSRRRFPSAVRIVAAVAVAAVVGLLAPILVEPVASAVAAGTGVTVTGPNPAWNEYTNSYFGSDPTATVNETQNLIDQTVQVSWTNFSPSTDNPYDLTTPETGLYYGGDNIDLYPVAVLECRGSDPVPDGLPGANSVTNQNADLCFTPTAGAINTTGGLGNAVYSVSRADGSGSVTMHIENAESNSFLGCDPTHACSIVVLPVFGGKQFSGETQANCANHKQDYPTAANGYNPSSFASNGLLGATCSWANRLVVPLSFAATPTNCPKRSQSFAAAGSPMLSLAIQQWTAGWCLDSDGPSFSYNSTTDEYQARSSFLSGGGALSSSTDVALTSQPASTGSATRKFTYAPIANTDVAVAFVIDDAITGVQVPQLTLNARLVAKLLTQSYSLRYGCLDGGDTSKQSTSCDPAVKGNPESIFQDPEFLALNPQLTAADFDQLNVSAGDFLPTVVGGNSDLTWALTSWIASDPDASAFLKGAADPWGMRVNSYYLGEQFPTSQLEELDPGYTTSADPPGNGTMQNAWQPVSGLDTVGTYLVGNSTTAKQTFPSACSAPPCSYPRIIDPLGGRNLFAILDQGTASDYSFPTARLVNSSGDAVAPTLTGVVAGLAGMKTNADGITQQMTYPTTNAQTYPLTVADYAMVPTCGVSATVANGVREFLGKVASSQVYGDTPGTIAPGYYALTTKQLTQLTAAQAAVSTASCSPTSAHPTSTAATSSSPRPSTTASSGSGTRSPQTSSQSLAAPRAIGTTAKTSATTASTPTPTPAATSATTPTVAPSLSAYGYKPTSDATATGIVLPLILLAGAALLLGGPGVYLLMTTGAAAGIATWTRSRLGSWRGRG